MAPEPAQPSSIVAISQASIAPDTGAQRTPALPLPPAAVILPIFFLVGYATLAISGFDSGLGFVQALPVYTFCGFLLLYLQYYLQAEVTKRRSSQFRTVGRLLYIYVTSGFAVVYAGEVIFGGAGNFTQSPYTYLIINALLLIVFIVDAIQRRAADSAALNAIAQTSPDASIVTRLRVLRRMYPISYGAFAIDFAGLSILFFISSLLLDLLDKQVWLRAIGVHFGAPYVTVDLNQTFGLHLAPNIHLLEGFDLVIAFAATAISLLFLGLVGVEAVATSKEQPISIDQTANGVAVRVFGASIQFILGDALSKTLLSLRLVLSPLVWLIPAFSIGAFSQQVIRYLNRAAQQPGSTLLDLFNPVSTVSIASFGQGVLNIMLGLLALGSVIVAVAVVEHSLTVLRRTLAIFGDGGQILALTLALFLYSLAALNAVIVFASNNHAEPFQVGAPGLLSLLLGAGFILFTIARSQRRPNIPATPAQTTQSERQGA